MVISARQIIRDSLETLEQSMALDFARGYFFSEGDVQFSVMRHLYEKISANNDNWFVASEHRLQCKLQPDILCYLLPEDHANFINNREKYLIAVIEVKYWKSPLDDLKKLRKIEERYKCLVWTVFVNHFDVSIHKNYAKKHIGYIKKVEEWVNKSPKSRGATIIKCCQIGNDGKYKSYAERMNAIRDYYWIND